MKFIIADDHVLFRDGLKYLLMRLGIEISVSEAGSYSEILGLARSQSFDIALIDLDMPGMSGIKSVGELRDVLDDCRIVVLSANQQSEMPGYAKKMGAFGYIPKSVSSECLISALKVVISGKPCFFDINKNIINAPKIKKEGVRQLYVSLTQREIEVLRLLVKGKTNKEIASILCISNSTVKTHVIGVFRALNVHNRTHAVHRALGLGLL